MPWREYQSYQGCREQHLNQSYIAVIAAEYLRKRVRVVDPESPGGP